MADSTLETLNRCLSLVPIVLQHQGISVDELAKRALSTREQVLEDLSSTLLMCGVPPYFPHDYICFSLEGDRVHMAFADHFRRPVSLNAIEALSLKIACESTAPLGERPNKSIQVLLRKVEESMGPKQRSLFRSLSKRVRLAEDAVESGSSIQQRLASALFDRRVISLDYVAGRDGVARALDLHPYGGVHRDGHWYLVALVEGESAPRFFRFDRVRGMRVLDRHFEIPASLRLEEWTRRPLLGFEAHQRAKVRFTGVAARWIREGAEAGSVEDGADGSALWYPQIADEESLAKVLLAFGGEFEVLAPESLRQKVQRLLQAVLTAHS